MNIYAGQIHLWTQWLAVSNEQLEAFLQLLSADELERAHRFHFEIHRNRFIVARGRLRQILGSYLEKPPQHLEFCYGPYGKPALVTMPENLEFNLSHSENLAAYAISKIQELGIDVEQIRDGAAEEGVPERFFSPDEVACLRALSPTQQKAAFFRCWTRKEAYVKAKAEGLSIPLDSFDVSLRPEDPARFLRGGQGYSMYSFQVEPGYIGAIVAPGEGWVVLPQASG